MQKKDDLKTRLKTKIAFLISVLYEKRKGRKNEKMEREKRERKGDENAERIGYCPEDL